MDVGHGLADPFDQPAGQLRLIAHVEQSVFDRRAAAVDDEDLH